MADDVTSESWCERCQTYDSRHAACWFHNEWGRLRWSFGDGRRHWYSRRAWLRATLDRHLFRYETEHCQRCGRRVGLVWWSTIGWTTVVRDGGCLRCIRCFDREAKATGEFICWLAVTHDEYGEWVQAYFDAHRQGAVR